jgi:hypothetical protein
MKIFWERLITEPYNSHLPWLSIFSFDWISQALLCFGAIGWFLLGINLRPSTNQLTKAIHNDKQKFIFAGLLATTSYCVFLIATLELLVASVFFPWLTLTAHYIKSNNKNFWPYLCAFLLSSVMACANSSLAPLNASILLILFFILDLCDKRIVRALVIPSLVIYLLSPTLPWPDFPGHARLLSDDGLPGVIRPLLGPTVPIPIFNRLLALESYRSFLLYAGFLLVIISYFKQLKKNSVSTATFLLLILSTGILYWDLATPAAWSELSPLKSLGRIVPGWFEAPLFITLLGTLISALLYVTFITSAKFNFKNRYASALLTLTASCLLFYTHSELPKNSIEPLSSNSWALTKQNPVLRSMSCDNLKVVQNKLNSTFVPASEYISEIKFSRAVEGRNARRIIDRNRRTRWSSKSLGQNGSEWIQLNLNRQIQLNAIEIDPGLYQSDFPRGLEIIDCSPATKSSVLFKQQDWQGQIEFTASGVPFYSYQSHVRAWLGCEPKAVNVTCLKINQIGADSVYDWSVAEIRLGVAK